ncbi:MAG: proton extrusion protein PcxA [Leptolyngbyaceae cyanobacterium SM1_4_3]|nr:proton extrusion protein PcxA [Leptolyngbyaceae cyanobacterium SM1_4_3]
MPRNVFKQINQWIVKTPLRSLSEAYNAALAIQAIEEKHFAGEAIAQNSNHTDTAFSYFRDKRESYLQIIRLRLAEFRTSSLISNLLHSPDRRLSGEISQDSDEGMILEKLSLIESVLARYEIQRQLEATIFQKQDQQVDLLSQKASSDFDETASLQRIRSGSVFDTANQIKKELTPEYEREVLYELRTARKRALRAIRFLILLIVIPFMVQFAGKSLLIEPLIHHFHHAPQIVLTGEAKERALHDLAQFRESLEFDTLVNNSHQSQDSEEVLKAEANHLLERYSEESTEGIKNLMADGLAFVTFVGLIYFGRQQMVTLKSLIDRVFLGLNDATKVFLIILLTDMFVGYHSSHGWEVLLEGFAEHFGLPSNRNAIFLFIATVPVMMDATLKYWIFNYLTRKSPSAVAVYRTMNE